MIRVKIEVDSDLLQQLAYRMPGFFGAGVAPATQKAFTTSVQYIAKVWEAWTMGNNMIRGVPDIKRPSGKLAKSIRSERLGPFSAEIFTESPHMERIVNGTPEMDMKETYPYGKKSRVSKDGIPYLIVPIRWATPNKEGGPRAHFVNFIPKPLFNKIKRYKPYKRLAEYDKAGNIIGGETHFEKNYAGQDIERSDYNDDYDRFEGEGNMNGLVRSAGGGGYFTFRIISAASPAGSWIRKAVPPVDFESGLARTVTPVVEDVINEGLEADIGL